MCRFGLSRVQITSGCKFLHFSFILPLYLCPAPAYIHLRHHSLREREITVRKADFDSGVPQGAVLGPTFWNVLWIRLELTVNTAAIASANNLALVLRRKKEEII